MILQRVLQIVYPTACISCDAQIDQPQALCGKCWGNTGFITGLVCDACGVPLPGDAESAVVHCDDCLKLARPWAQGRAALVYSGNAKRLVLALKHGDRTDLAKPASVWMAKAAGPMIDKNTVVVPIPIHWRRMIKRRYNQAALLAHGAARNYDVKFEPRALVRTRPTAVHENMGLDARFANMAGAIAPNGRHGQKLADKSVVLVDDVMTSGATLAAATEACHAAGASRVSVLVLARVAKDT